MQSRRLLNLIQHYLRNREQLVLINERTSKRTNILAGVSQVSALGPLLFLVCINDFLDGLST